MFATGAVYVNYKYTFEVDRWRMWTRREHIQDLPAHHYVNRGGVLLEKDFVGFEKYHTSDKSLMDWYRKAYPHQMSTLDVKPEEGSGASH